MTAPKTNKPKRPEDGLAQLRKHYALMDKIAAGSMGQTPPEKAQTKAKPRIIRAQIFGRQVRMARAALGMTIKQFATLVGLSPNTISHVERGYATLSPTAQGIEDALAALKAIEWLPDTGNSVGIRLRYRHLSDAMDKRNPKVRTYKRGRSGRRIKFLGTNSVDADAELEERLGPDKRIKKPRGVPI
ncbi:MAG: helix-turn-helix domain-containing protein [Blastocatellia bacterium]